MLAKGQAPTKHVQLKSASGLADCMFDLIHRGVLKSRRREALEDSHIDVVCGGDNSPTERAGEQGRA